MSHMCRLFLGFFGKGSTDNSVAKKILISAKQKSREMFIKGFSHFFRV